jgi:hypothetical protein
MTNAAHGGNVTRNIPAPALTTYGDFVATHPPIFIEAGEPLEANHLLCAIDSKFGLLHYTEQQKIPFTVQQLWGDASTWWTNYTTARPADYQVSWAEFCSAFRAHHIWAGMMRKKYQDFMDLKQGGRSMHD